MRNPNLVNSSIDDKNSIKLKTIPLCEFQEYDLNNPKSLQRFINDVKRMIRNSFEYRSLMKYLKNNIDMNSCAVYKNIGSNTCKGMSIHIHHHPFTLEDIALIVLEKRKVLNEPTNIEEVAKEVMYIHYTLLIGLIPLSHTIHELVHGNHYFIPMNRVFGHVNLFELYYKDYMTQEQKELLEMNKKATQTYIYEMNTKKLLEVNPIRIEIEDEPLPKLDYVNKLMEEAKENYMR